MCFGLSELVLRMGATGRGACRQITTNKPVSNALNEKTRDVPLGEPVRKRADYASETSLLPIMVETLGGSAYLSFPNKFVRGTSPHLRWKCFTVGDAKTAVAASLR